MTTAIKAAQRAGHDYIAQGGRNIHSEAADRFPTSPHERRAFVTGGLDKLAAAADAAFAHQAAPCQRWVF